MDDTVKLVVYDMENAPSEKEELREWIKRQGEGLTAYEQAGAAAAAPDLQGWFLEMIRNFPPKSGELAPDQDKVDKSQELRLHLTDYQIGKNMICASFRQEAGKQAQDVAEKLAMVYDVGFLRLE